MMIPQFILIRNLGLSDTHLALILVNGFSPFGVFMLRQFFLSVPNELLEAARVDGMNEFGIFFKVAMPLAKTGFVSLGILTFLTIWNDFLIPLVFISSNNMRTLQLGIRLFVTAWSTDYALMMAVAVVGILPLFLVFVMGQKHIVEGIAMSGIKG